MPLRPRLKMATIIQASDIPSLSLLYKLHKLEPAPADTKPRPTLIGPSTIPAPSKALNDRVGLFRGDITTLAVDAIVNAANRSLLGGGGVDGAIHRAAGPGLLEECRKLNGCPTGFCKITGAYDLPCRKVIHAVGPIYDDYDSEKSERQLTSCYSESLSLAADNSCETIAFSGISTGVYGYPSRAAAPAALSAVRKFLEEDNRIRKVIFTTFEKKDVDAYNESLPMFFPPVPDQEVSAADEAKAKEKQAEAKKEKEATEAELDAKAQAVADELPSPPTADPSETDHVDKKQKHDQA
ncbi:hypothetical protein B0H63DRAFT_463939 [Podospora didyma]|uniref:Macro domain-containing protein n=1 Tax=Podospora didyma TaxID=330526 RepID=A0AAE0U3I2_9PEZI|nr:hypothetical protein B0H63DRAFT_463939 [Podospora didyma]